MRSPAVSERTVQQGAAIVANSAAEPGAFLKSEIDDWAKVVRTAGVDPR